MTNREMIHCPHNTLVQVPRPGGGWFLGDKATKTTLCMTVFNGNEFADVYDDHEEVTISVNADGKFYEGENEGDATIVRFGDYFVEKKKSK